MKRENFAAGQPRPPVRFEGWRVVDQFRFGEKPDIFIFIFENSEGEQRFQSLHLDKGKWVWVDIDNPLEEDDE